jgi:hypothetical protein
MRCAPPTPQTPLAPDQSPAAASSEGPLAAASSRGSCCCRLHRLHRSRPFHGAPELFVVLLAKAGRYLLASFLGTTLRERERERFRMHSMRIQVGVGDVVIILLEEGSPYLDRT